MLKEVIIVLIVFSSILFGLLLQKVTENEIKPGKKYFIFIEYVLLLILAVFLLHYSFSNYWVIVSFVAGLFAGLEGEYK